LLFNRGQPFHFFFEFRQLFPKPRLVSSTVSDGSSPAQSGAAVSSWLISAPRSLRCASGGLDLLPFAEGCGTAHALNCWPSVATLAFVGRRHLAGQLTIAAQGPLDPRKIVLAEVGDGL